MPVKQLIPSLRIALTATRNQLRFRVKTHRAAIYPAPPSAAIPRLTTPQKATLPVGPLRRDLPIGRALAPWIGWIRLDLPGLTWNWLELVGFPMVAVRQHPQFRTPHSALTEVGLGRINLDLSGLP